MEHHSPGPESCRIGRERRYRSRNEIRIDEVRTVCVFREKLVGEGGFARAIRSGNDV